MSRIAIRMFGLSVGLLAPGRSRVLAFVLLVVLSAGGCENYATVRERTPRYRAASPAGELIVRAQKKPLRAPEAQMGRFIDAAALSARVLEKDPGNLQAMQDYNFAISRLFDTLHASGLEPWKKPVPCPGANGVWQFRLLSDGKAQHNPTFYRILPADRFEFRGKFVRERTLKAGLGAPMVIASTGFDPTVYDPFIQGRSVYYGITEILRFDGRNVTAAYIDPLATENVRFAGKVYPVAADFTAPIGLALAELRPRRIEILRMFKPEAFADTTRLARLQPYDPGKIPVLCIHGLGDSQATWAPMIESLRGDAEFRKNYQIWFFSYPTGFPYPLMAAVLRQKMDEIKKFHPNHRDIVVIGHSMGGMIARTLITDSDEEIWRAFFDTPPAQTPLSDKARAVIRKSLIFEPRDDIARVIFANASLRGADMATSLWGRLGAAIIDVPSSLSDVGKELARLSRKRDDGRRLLRLPNSIDALDPDNRFVTTINRIPVTPGIPYHSIIADRGRGGNLDRRPPQSNDGLVPYWSAHIEGAESEIIVPTDHWSIHHPPAIEEVKRILRLHLREQRGKKIAPAQKTTRQSAPPAQRFPLPGQTGAAAKS